MSPCRRSIPAVLAVWLTVLAPGFGAENVSLVDVPDYTWHVGCFGTAAGNMMGFWDRHGFPDFYTGPTSDGLAPLNSNGLNAGIRSMWASRAGFDGRPADQPGHVDDYWTFYVDDVVLSYESTAPDPYQTAGRTEHELDCIGDFIGASQNKWQNINDEHDGNIDAHAFVIWDMIGGKRSNFDPTPMDGVPVRDIPSGLRAWTRFRGHEADVFSQLVDFNPEVPAGAGFTFEDLKAEIDAGYPVMLYLQHSHEKFRNLSGMPKANPNVHGMLAYGYYIADSGARYVRYKTSWGGSGDNRLKQWNNAEWETKLPVRGVIGYHPLPRITSIQPGSGTFTIQWHGPLATLSDLNASTTIPLHRYVVERAPALNEGEFVAASEPTAALEATVSVPAGEAGYFRVRLLPPD